MKAIMYHYVRPDSQELPYFRHLHVDDFARQLEYFGNEYGFVGIKEFRESLSSGVPAKGVILTFDDGFIDHYHYVLPLLKRYSIWGIFYIPTSPLVVNKLIDVHRIHMLIGKYGGIAIADAVRGMVDQEMLSHDHIREFRTETYSRQNNDASTTYVKRVLNYFIDYRYRESVIDRLMATFYPNEEALIADFYMTEGKLQAMHEAGNVIGSHTVNHPVMSKLAVDEQQREIAESFARLEAIVGDLGLKTFCYPYGGFHTFSAATEAMLEESGCHFAFNVEHRDITAEDLRKRRQALPRYDCNLFPYGTFRERRS